LTPITSLTLTPAPTSTPARAFDPAIETQKLRDHLASHDKPITFLFGAGTSAAVIGVDGKSLVPAVAELTKRCRAAVLALGAEFAPAWDAILEGLPTDRRTIEDILSAVRQMREVVHNDDKLAGLDATQLQALVDGIQQAISREVRPDASRVPAELPHHQLGRWIHRIERSCAVEIFTLNYDTLLERGLEDEWVPVFDGFIGAHRPFFSSASLAREPMAPGRRWTRLWKIHGSVTWSLEERGSDNASRVLRGEEHDSGELILPSLLKYDESRKQPYVAMIDRLRRQLAEREDAILVTAGYSFGDQHINEVIFEALAANPRLHAFALCFNDPPTDGELMRAAARQRNLLVLAPRLAVVGGQAGPWMLRDPDADGGRVAGFFTPDTTVHGPVAGALSLGDFNVLCKLLDQIARGDDD
jgi:hypothetical protein